MEPDAIAAALTDYINANIMAPSCPISADDHLESAGVDSMGLLKVLLYIEARFGFWMPDEHLVDENVESPRALARYIWLRQSTS